MINEAVKQEIKDSITVKQLVLDDTVLIQKVIDLANSCIKSLREGGKIIFISIFPIWI